MQAEYNKNKVKKLASKFLQLFKLLLIKWQIAASHWWNNEPPSFNVYGGDIHEFYGALPKKSNHAIEKVKDQLGKAFAERKVNHHLMGNQWWSDFVIASSRNDDEGSSNQEKLIAHVDSMSPNLMDYHELHYIYYLALSVGLFNVAYSLRSKSREAAINLLNRKVGPKSRHQRFKIVKAATALLETKNFAGYEKYISSNASLLGNMQNPMIFFYELMTSRVISTKSNEEVALIPKNIEDDYFHMYVNDKTVAVVGPLATSLYDGELIDEHDIVVRCNYKKGGPGVNAKVKGRRCDISYYNVREAQYIYIQEPEIFPECIKWAVCKIEDDKLNLSRLLKDRNVKRENKSMSDNNICVRNLYSMNKLLFNGTLNAIPNAILDLSRFSPRVIRVFHSDLFLSPRYASGYEANYFREWYEEGRFQELFVKRVMKKHDPVTQYWVLNCLWSQGRIIGDKRFNEVMQLGEREYMRQLQIIYGQSGRVLLESHR